MCLALIDFWQKCQEYTLEERQFFFNKWCGAPVEISIEDPQILKIELPSDPAIHSWACIWRNISQYTVKIPAHPCLLGAIHNSQTMESAYVSINRWIDKENVVYSSLKRTEVKSFAGKSSCYSK
jgi:hypothetical protein